MSLGPPPSASTLAEVRHQVSRHASVLYRCLWTPVQEPSSQPRGRHTSASPTVTYSSCSPASTGPPAEKCPRGARRGSREIPAVNKRMSKDLSSRGILGTSHSASSDTRGHSSFQLMEDSSRLVTKDTRVLPPQKSKEAMVIFSQAWLLPARGESRLRFSTRVRVTAARRFRSSCETGPYRELFVPQALLGLVSSPAARSNPFSGLLGEHKAQVHCCAYRDQARPANPACEKVGSW